MKSSYAHAIGQHDDEMSPRNHSLSKLKSGTFLQQWHKGRAELNTYRRRKLVEWTQRVKKSENICHSEQRPIDQKKTKYRKIVSVCSVNVFIQIVWVAHLDACYGSDEIIVFFFFQSINRNRNTIANKHHEYEYVKRKLTATHTHTTIIVTLSIKCDWLIDSHKNKYTSTILS